MRVFILLFSISFFSFKFNLRAIYTCMDLPIIKSLSDKDSIHKIEYLSSLKLHQKINDYRNSKNLQTLEWNDTFWIASINHSIYMLKNDSLTHIQSEKSNLFTGIDAGNRIQFAYKEIKRPAWSGENCLYHYAAKGNSIEEIANNIANKSFQLWRDSQGHHKNILRPESQIHAVAFKIQGKKVFGTSVFGYRR
jgi:uncharacterized protein YkwD